MPSIDGVEIFKTGIHKGVKYTEQDLDDIVEAFKDLDYKPPVKAGHHNDKPGMPRLGWVSAMYRVGASLFTDWSDVPEPVHDAIKKKMFNQVSAEIYHNLVRAGRKYRRALKAVSLLGADIPSVPGLKEVYESIGGDELSYTHTFSFNIGDETANVVQTKDLRALQASVKALDQRLAKFSWKLKG
jgi:hypothetical protein